MKAYFVSDIHIKSEDKNNGEKFLRFLENLPDDTTHLVLLGDIFDLWVGSHEYFIKKFSQTIDQIRKVLNNNVEIHYFEGNHDLHLKSFWEKSLGITVHRDEYFFELGNITVRAEHGDLMNKDDKGYLFLRKALRTFPMNVLATQLPGKIVEAIGDRSSRASRFYNDRHSKNYRSKVIEITRQYAQNVAQERPFDIIITGHTHVEDDFTFEQSGKTVRSINLGTWLDRPKAFLLTSTEQKFIDL